MSSIIMSSPEKITYPSLPPTLVLTSTKSYFSPTRTLSYLESLLNPTNGILPVPDSILFALIPDHLTIYPCSELLSRHTSTAHPTPSSWPLSLGAQDCFSEPQYGAYTGFTVPSALKALGVSIVELGHAERRKFVGENDSVVAKKAAAVTSLGMVPLVCIGELEKPNLNAPMSMSVGTAMRQLQPQITSLLDAVPKDAPVIFAYEPVWAIGASQPAGVEYVGPVVQAIRSEIANAEKKGRTGTTRVVYGGSAGPGLWSGKSNGGNALGKYVDGMFLGRFAHEIKGVKDVVDEVVGSLQGRE
jgi:triosephosphate isomerase (TIM)